MSDGRGTWVTTLFDYGKMFNNVSTIPCESTKTLHFENHLLFKIYALNMSMSDIIL